MRAPKLMLTPSCLRPLVQFIYYFSVHVVKALGMREDSVLQINLLGEGGIAGGTVQRWRGGEPADSRPLSTLHRVEADPAAPSALKLHFRPPDGKASTMHLVARSPSDRSTILLLLTTLTTASGALDHYGMWGTPKRRKTPASVAAAQPPQGAV